MTDKEKADLVQGYTKNYHYLTGEYIRLVFCSKWESLAAFTERVEYWKLVRVIFDLTGWGKSKTFSKCRQKEYVFRRELIDYIAVKNGCSYNQCARLTDRDHTTVINSVSNFESRLNTSTEVKVFFTEVMEYIRENYHIYNNQTINEESFVTNVKLQPI